MKTPVAFIIFNRPDTAARVFAEIARARPAKLLVIADGPRANRAGEAELCREARAVVEQIDWDCEVLTNFAAENLGCRRRVSSGLDWVFENCEEAIILEDDCLPHPSFFPYCEALLDKYREDERVMMITGNNFQPGTCPDRSSYYFSRYPFIWGWASWRRAWRHFDPEAKVWSLVREDARLLELLGDIEAVRYWQSVFDKKFSGSMDDVWDFQWTLACWAQNGLAAAPCVNLVSNIGWGDDATHTKDPANPLANLPSAEMIFPLTHPPIMVRDLEADRRTFDRVWKYDAMPSGVIDRLRRRVAGGIRRSRR